MANIELFLLTCIETISIMVIWNSLGLNGRRKYSKIVAIVIIVSTVVVITNAINSVISMYINYIILNVMVKLLFNKTISETLTEFSIGAAICIFMEIILIGVIGDFDSNLYLATYISIKDILVNIVLLLIT